MKTYIIAAILAGIVALAPKVSAQTDSNKNHTFKGSGSPNTNAVQGYQGDLYSDVSSGALWIKGSGFGTSGWVELFDANYNVVGSGTLTSGTLVNPAISGTLTYLGVPLISGTGVLTNSMNMVLSGTADFTGGVRTGTAGSVFHTVLDGANALSSGTVVVVFPSAIGVIAQASGTGAGLLTYTIASGSVTITSTNTGISTPVSYHIWK